LKIKLHNSLFNIISLLVILFISSSSLVAQKKDYYDWREHKVTVPLGSIAFADTMVSAIKGNPPASTFFTKEVYIVGPPDSNMYSLGYGASVTVKFTDNALIDLKGPDLYIFEVGGSFEPTQVEISKDGKEWINVGIVNEYSAALDIAPFIQVFDKFYYVRLTDLMTNYKPNKRFGADIDAVVALNAIDMTSPCADVSQFFNKQITKWSAKGMFETTAEYNKRLKDSLKFATRNFKYKAIQSVAHKKAVLNYADFDYDADNSIVTINTPNIKDLTFKLTREKAKEFYKNINNLKVLNPDFSLDCTKGKFVLQKAELKNIKTTINYTAPDYYEQPLHKLQLDKKSTIVKKEEPKINNTKKVVKVAKSANFDSKKIKTAQLKVGQKFQLPNLYFAPDSYALTKSAKRTLLRLYRFLNDNPKLKIEIGGHTNTLPPDDYSDTLSTNRAKNVAYYLFTKGISKDRITYKGYGKRRPINTTFTDAARLQNQRVEIKVIALK
jgi:outer membrane protein OmpA-like peptidoglycan-associated protein